MSKKIVDVAVGLIQRPDGRLLFGQRPEGKPWSGWWEFPGGKIEAGESVLQALARELQEELGISVTQSRPWVTYIHAYPTTTVRLAFCHVTGWDGEPRGLENQSLKWVHPQQAASVGQLLPATLPPLRWLALPTTYAITAIGTASALPAFLPRLEKALSQGLKLVQLREPQWSDGTDATSLYRAFLSIRERCHAAGARLLLNSCHPVSWWHDADGVHLRASDAAPLQQRPVLPNGMLLGVSAHNQTQIFKARDIDADFAVLGPVLDTPSHPHAQTLGWAGFVAATQDAGLPVFALGGQATDTQTQAQHHGAHGIAGIRGLI